MMKWQSWKHGKHNKERILIYLNNIRRRMIRTVMLSLKSNTNNITFIKDEYKRQLKVLKADCADPENDPQIKAVEEKIKKLFSLEWDMKDVYEDLEDVISPMKVGNAQFDRIRCDENEIYKKIIEDLNSGSDDLEMVAEEEQEAFDNVEEHFPGSMRAMEMEEYVTTLGMAIDEIYDIIAKLEKLIE